MEYSAARLCVLYRDPGTAYAYNGVTHGRRGQTASFYVYPENERLVNYVRPAACRTQIFFNGPWSTVYAQKAEDERRKTFLLQHCSPLLSRKRLYMADDDEINEQIK